MMLGQGDTMLSYRNRLLLVGGVVTIAVLGTIFLQAPEPTLTVDELMENKSTHLGEEVAVRGEIRDGSINESSMTFVLEGTDFDLVIDYSNAGSISNGLGAIEPCMQRVFSPQQTALIPSKRTLSKPLAHRNMKKKHDLRNRLIEIHLPYRVCWDRWGARRTLYHKSSLWWAECLGAAKAAHGFLHADVDVSPPHDPGVVNRFRRETGIK